MTKPGASSRSPYPRRRKPIEQIPFDATLWASFVEADARADAVEPSARFMGSRPAWAGAVQSLQERKPQKKAPAEQEPGRAGGRHGRGASGRLRDRCPVPRLLPDPARRGLNVRGAALLHDRRGGAVGSGESRERFPAYRIVLEGAEVGEYYGIQGTAWQDAQEGPARASDRRSSPPRSGKTVNGREFELYITTGTGSASSPGRRRRASTGSPTRCSGPSPPARC